MDKVYQNSGYHQRWAKNKTKDMRAANILIRIQIKMAVLTDRNRRPFRVGQSSFPEC